MAVLYLALSVTRLLASIVGNQVYAATVSIIQGRLVFFCQALVQIISSGFVL